MTNKEAIQILNEQRNEFMDKWVDYGGVNEAYNIAIQALKEQEIVRCKDCKHGEKPQTFRYYPEITWCNKHSTSHNDDWFCADGERRDG